MGRWSRLVAPKFVDWLDVSPGGSWVEVGCGTGALTSAILERADPLSVLAADPSPAFLGQARDSISDDRVSFALGDAQHLPADDDDIADAVVSGLILTFVPDLAAGLREMCRVSRPGGVVAAYVWDYAGKMQMVRVFWDVVAENDPSALALDEGLSFRAFSPEALERAFSAAGLTRTESTAIDVPTLFADFDDFWRPFLGGQGPAASYVVSLSESRRDELRDLLRERLPAEPDGSIPLTARAWAVRGFSA